MSARSTGAAPSNRVCCHARPRLRRAATAASQATATAFAAKIFESPASSRRCPRAPRLLSNACPKTFTKGTSAKFLAAMALFRTSIFPSTGLLEQTAARPTFSSATARTQRPPFPTCTRARLTVQSLTSRLCCLVACSRRNPPWPGAAPTSIHGFPSTVLLAGDAARAASLGLAATMTGLVPFDAALHRPVDMARDLPPTTVPNARALVLPFDRRPEGPETLVEDSGSAAPRTTRTRRDRDPSRLLCDDSVAAGALTTARAVAAVTVASTAMAAAATGPSVRAGAIVERWLPLVERHEKWARNIGLVMGQEGVASWQNTRSARLSIAYVVMDQRSL